MLSHRGHLLCIYIRDIFTYHNWARVRVPTGIYQAYASCLLVAKLCPTLLQPNGLQPTRLLCPWDFPGKNTGVSCHFLLQCMKVKMKVKSLIYVQLLATHGLQPTRLLCPWDFPGKSTAVGCLAHQNPLPVEIFPTRILEWVAVLYSKECSQPGDQTLVSSIAYTGR